MAESAIDGVTLSERFDASDLDSEYLRARLFEPPVVGGWRCPSGRASWRRGVRCRRAQSRGRYEAIQPGRSRDGPVDDLRDRVEMIQKTQGALGRRGWREPPVEGRGAGFPSRGPQLACRRQPRRSQSCGIAIMPIQRVAWPLAVGSDHSAWGAGMIGFVTERSSGGGAGAPPPGRRRSPGRARPDDSDRGEALAGAGAVGVLDRRHCRSAHRARGSENRPDPTARTAEIRWSRRPSRICCTADSPQAPPGSAYARAQSSVGRFLDHWLTLCQAKLISPPHAATLMTLVLNALIAAPSEPRCYPDSSCIATASGDGRGGRPPRSLGRSERPVTGAVSETALSCRDSRLVIRSGSAVGVPPFVGLIDHGSRLTARRRGGTIRSPHERYAATNAAGSWSRDWMSSFA